jgi:hypothetical protein
MDSIQIGQRNVAEFQELLKVYREIKPFYVVEIGSWKGGTLWHWLNEAPEGAHVVSINLSPKDWMSPDPDFKPAIWRGETPTTVSEGVNMIDLTQPPLGNSRRTTLSPLLS